MAQATPADIERATLRTVTWRILPFLMPADFVAFVDRVNAGFAALQMNQDIGLSAGATAAGIAQINAIGNIGGFLGTSLLDVIKDATGSYPLGLMPLVLLSGAGCALVLGLGRGKPGAGVPARA